MTEVYLTPELVNFLKKKCGLTCVKYSALENTFTCKEYGDVFAPCDMYENCCECTNYMRAISKVAELFGLED
jgi:hypothetical protein